MLQHIIQPARGCTEKRSWFVPTSDVKVHSSLCWPSHSPCIHGWPRVNHWPGVLLPTSANHNPAFKSPLDCPAFEPHNKVISNLMWFWIMNTFKALFSQNTTTDSCSSPKWTFAIWWVFSAWECTQMLWLRHTVEGKGRRSSLWGVTSS